MSQVNLLPPISCRRSVSASDARGGRAAASSWSLRSSASTSLQSSELSSVNDEIEAQEATNASIQASIAEKQKFADLQAEAQAQQQLLSAAFAGEVSFSALLMDFSRVIPSDAYVNSLGDPSRPSAAGRHRGRDHGP